MDQFDCQHYRRNVAGFHEPAIQRPKRAQVFMFYRQVSEVSAAFDGINYDDIYILSTDIITPYSTKELCWIARVGLTWPKNLSHKYYGCLITGTNIDFDSLPRNFFGLDADSVENLPVRCPTKGAAFAIVGPINSRLIDSKIPINSIIRESCEYYLIRYAHLARFCPTGMPSSCNVFIYDENGIYIMDQYSTNKSKTPLIDREDPHIDQLLDWANKNKVELPFFPNTSLDIN